MQVDAELIARAGSRLAKLEEEERLRIEEEKRLAALAAAQKAVCHITIPHLVHVAHPAAPELSTRWHFAWVL